MKIFKIIIFSCLLFVNNSYGQNYWKDKARGVWENNDRNKSTNISSARFLSIDFNIVSNYAPVLHFHPREGRQCCYPSSAETAYYRARSGNTGEHREPLTLNDNAPCYYEVFGTNEGFRIKYWFWYNYNDYPTGPDIAGSHPGDWEYVEIFFRNGSPYQYNFSNHTGARIKTQNEVIIQNNKLQVWVGNGSHANYESPNPQNVYSYLGFGDEIEDGGSIWNSANNLIFVLNTNFGRDNYTGDWGDGKQIFGPLNRTVE